MASSANAHDSNCDNTTAGDPIHCEEGSASTDDIAINASSIDIDTMGDDAEGVKAAHAGEGNISINITGTTATPSTIDTTGSRSHAILADHTGSGDKIDINVENTEITTTGNRTYAIRADSSKSTGVDSMKIQLGSGTSITTSGTASEGVFGYLLSDDGDLDVDLLDSSITTQGTDAPAISLYHGRTAGVGNLLVDLTRTRIETQGTQVDAFTGFVTAHGLYALHAGTGNIEFRAPTNGGSIVTKGIRSFGIYGHHQGTGDIDIDIMNANIITESMDEAVDGLTLAIGVYAQHQKSGDIDIDMNGGSVKTAGTYSYGLYGDHEDNGKVMIDTLNGHAITTTGTNGHGIVAYQRSTTATPRTIDIGVGGPVTVSGTGAQGVRVGAVISDVPERMATLDADGYRQQTVTVNNVISSQGPGIYLTNGGRVIIGSRGRITSGSGIAILATGTVDSGMATEILPKLWVDLNLGGRRIAQVLGDDWIINDGGETTIAMNGTVLHGEYDDGTGTKIFGVVPNTKAANGVWDVTLRAEGVKVTDRTTDPWTQSTRAAGVIADRDFSTADFSERQVRFPPPPEPEAMQVDAPVVADASAPAAVVVEGDGTVQIGAQGSVRAASGIAILATGDTPELTVDMNLDGRQMMQVIGDDWIINDGGGTTLVINGVKLHDATTGVVAGAAAPNGARNVRMAEADSVHIRAEGVRILDRTDPDPANWVLSDPAQGVIADRDFSAEDFIRNAGVTQPDPTTPPMFIEEYSPRAALYEVLPNVLLALQQRTPRSRPDQPAWLRVTGSTGSHELDRSTVGAQYDTDYLEIEAGKHFTLENGLEAWAALQYLTGTAEVDSPMKGGDIDVQGLGLSLELCSGCKTGDRYVSGRLSLSRYALDLDSDERGRLKSGVDAGAYALQLEVGRRLQRGNIQLSPRLRLDHARVSVDRFTDTVDARVSYSDEGRTVVALGVMAETRKNTEEDGLSLWGSVDFEHCLGNPRTVARVSGERLSARTGDSSVLLGAGGTWSKGNLKIIAGLSAREGLDTGSEDYSATLNLGMQF